MTTALIKALNQSRANYNLAYQRGIDLKASGASFFDIGPVGMGASQFGQFQSDSANKRRYQAYRGWVHSAIHALAKKAAGQAVNLGTTNSKESEKPGKTKSLVLNKMTQSARSKAAKDEIEVIQKHPFLGALEKPNAIQARWQFVYSFVANLCLTGWSYVVADDVGDDGYQFYSVPTTWVRPIHKKGPFSEFKIVNPNNPESYDDNSKPLDRSRVTFAYIPDPANIFSALAPTKAQEDSVKIDDYIQSSQQVFFQNGVFPSVILTIGTNPMPDVPKGEYRPRLTAAQRRQINAAIRKVSSGVANYGNPAIVDGLIEKIERLSATSNEMGWEKSEKINRTRLLSAFGVHPFILGEAVAGSYAQSYNVEKIFFENVNTYLDMLGSCMTHFAGVLTGEEDLLVWWTACRPIDPAQESSQWNQARARDDVTQNEWRAYMDLPPDEDKNQNIIGKSVKEVLAVAAQVKGGQLTPEQGEAILIGLGLPDEDAKKIAGDGPSEEDKANALAQQQAAQMQGQPGQKPGDGQPQPGQPKPPKPPKKKPEQEVAEKVEKAIELLQRPIVISVKEVDDKVERVLQNV